MLQKSLWIEVNMDSTVTEIGQDVYRISTFHAGFGIQFNRFLLNAHDGAAAIENVARFLEQALGWRW